MAKYKQSFVIQEMSQLLFATLEIGLANILIKLKHLPWFTHHPSPTCTWSPQHCRSKGSDGKV